MSLDKYFSIKSSQTKPKSKILSDSQTETLSQKDKKDKKIQLSQNSQISQNSQKQSKEQKEQKELNETKKPKQTKTKNSFELLTRKLSKDESKSLKSQTKTRKPLEEKSSNHYNPFTHDTTAKNKGSKLYVEKELFDPNDECNPFGENEFMGKNFVISGILEEMDRDEMKKYIINWGGNVTSAISGKTIVLVAGDEVGPAKMRQANERGIKVWKEDDVFQYIKDAMSLTDDDILAKKQNDPNAKKKNVKNEVKIDQSKELQNQIDELQKKMENETIWTEKYRPIVIDDLCGNTTQIKKIFDWMKKWETMIPNRRCLLLAGPPGVGKTTVSKIVGRSLGYNPIEFNASDVRNKSAIDKQVKSILLSGQMNFTTTKTQTGEIKSEFNLKKQALIIMDEVDGMSSDDRGGIAELVKLIKTIEQPIICICNDINNKKMQSLIGVSESIIFGKVSIQDVKKRLQYICEKENVTIEDDAMTQIIMKSRGDVRYAINMLQTYVQNGVILSEKNEDIDYIDIIPSLITDFKKTTLFQKNDIFFMDNFMMPIYLHDSLYRHQKFTELSKAFSAFAYGDIFQALVSKTQNWKLMPICVTFKVHITTYYGQTKNTAVKIAFPKTLAKISKRKGNQTRLLMMTHNTPGKLMASRDFSAIPMMYIRNTIIRCMKTDPKKAAEIAYKFGLTKTSWDEMIKVGEGLENVHIFSQVPTKNKTEFTRTLNAATNASTKTTRATKGTRGKAKDEEEEDDIDIKEEDDDEMSEEEEDEYIPDQDDYY